MPEVSSQILVFFNKMHLEALVRKIQRCGHTRQTAADYEGFINNFQAPFIQRLQQSGLGNRHPHKVLRFSRGRFRFIHMHPRTLVSDVGHLKEVFIKAGFATGIAEKRLVSSRTA